MAELHVDASFQNVVSLGQEVFEYYSDKGPTDIHTVDSALELSQNANALLRDHSDAVYAASPSVEMPKDADEAVKKIKDECDQAKQYKGASINPGTILKIWTWVKFVLEDILPKLKK